VVYLAAL